MFNNVTGWAVGEDATSAKLQELLEDVRLIGSPPGLVVRLTSAQEVASAANVEWSTATFDNTLSESMWAGANADRIIIPEDGMYVVILNASYGTTGLASFVPVKAEITVNGDVRAGSSTLSSQQTRQNLSVGTNLAAGQLVRGRISHESSGDVTVLSGMTFMHVFRIGLPGGAV